MKYDVSLQTIAWFNGRRSDQSLEISPKFQRRPVWLESERSALLGTIFSELPFPEIYIQHQTNPADGKERHIVVDGQQRITSILMFIDGEISLPDDDDWDGQYFRDFDDDEKEAFWNYKVVVRSLSQTNDSEIRDFVYSPKHKQHRLKRPRATKRSLQGTFQGSGRATCR